MKPTSGRPSKTIPWKKEGPLGIPVSAKQQVYTCIIDKSKRPSAIQDAKEGQKCTVILEDEPMPKDEEIMRTIIEILTSDDPEIHKIVEETLKMSEEEMIEFLHSGRSDKIDPPTILLHSQEPVNYDVWKNKCTQDLIEAINKRYPLDEQTHDK